MPVLRPSGSDFTAFVKAAAAYTPSGSSSKGTSAAGAASLGARVRASQIGALASPTTAIVSLNGITAPPSGPRTPIPKGINGLKIWLDGSDVSSMSLNGTNNLLSWTNLATGTVGAVPASSVTRPLRVASAYNSLGAVQFDVGTRMVIGPNTYTSPYKCVIAVITTPSDPLVTNKQTFFFGEDNDRATGSGLVAYNWYNQIEYYCPGTVGQAGGTYAPYFNTTPWLLSFQGSSTAGNGVYYNGTKASALNSSTFTTGTFTEYMGAARSGTNAFTINEFIHYDSDLTALQRQKIEGYLAWKWGIQSFLPAGHNHKTSAPSA